MLKYIYFQQPSIRILSKRFHLTVAEENNIMNCLRSLSQYPYLKKKQKTKKQKNKKKKHTILDVRSI